MKKTKFAAVLMMSLLMTAGIFMGCPQAANPGSGTENPGEQPGTDDPGKDDPGTGGGGGTTTTQLTAADVTKFADKADISKILKNHTYGLAGILRSLFTDNTLPGEIRYYLSADWLAQNTDNDSNIPGILNKPKVVLG